MKLSQVVRRIRETAPIFAKRVGGASEFMAATSRNADIPSPHCFVIPSSEDATSGLQGGDRTLFEMDETFATVVCISNVVQRNSGKDGVGADDLLHEVRKQLQQAFAGWHAEMHFTAVRFIRGRHVSMDNARLWHQFEWGVSYTECMGTPANPLQDANITKIYGKATVDERQGRPSVLDGIVVEGAESYPEPTPQELDMERRARIIIEGQSGPSPKVDPPPYEEGGFHHGQEAEDA